MPEYTLTALGFYVIDEASIFRSEDKGSLDGENDVL